VDAIHGRGAAENPPNRFEKIEFVPDPDDPDAPSPKTVFYRDASKSIISTNDSPDLGFEASINPYRGCEHGCSYCYARPYHEYLGFSAGLDFETKIMVKEDAPELLRAELSKKSWTPKLVAFSGVTDCYQPIERKLLITRRCLNVFAEFRNPVSVITKNFLVTRDLDVLRELAEHQCVAVCLSITTLDNDLHHVMEPRTSVPARRFAAIEALAKAGIPASVNVAPVIPGLTDHELPSILKAAREAGATGAGYVMLRLPHGVKDLFEAWIRRHRPNAAEKVLNRVRDVRGGSLNDPSFGSRMRGEGAFAKTVKQMFDITCRRFGLNVVRDELSTASFRRPDSQLTLF